MATSIVYVSGRGPFDEEFSIKSVTGWLSTSIRAPFGSSSFGAEISTPGIGPAIVELKGLELFFVSQAASASTSGSAHTNTYLCIFNSTAGVYETYGRAQFSVSAQPSPTGRSFALAAGLGPGRGAVYEERPSW